MRRCFVWGKRLLHSEVRTGKGEATCKRFILSVLVRNIVLLLEDKLSPKEKELIPGSVGGVSPSPVAEMGQRCTIDVLLYMFDCFKFFFFLLNLDVCFALRN